MSKDLLLYGIGAVLMLTVLDHASWSGLCFDIGWAVYGVWIVVNAIRMSAAHTPQPKPKPSLEEWLGLK